MATEIAFTTKQRTVPRHRVYVRAAWDAEWEEVEHLHCDSCTFTANPEMAKAQFNWQYGSVQHPGGEWEIFARLEHLRSYVKVEFTATDDEAPLDENDEPLPTIWYGILEEDNGEQKGVLASPDDGHAKGRQVLVAYGLDIMLQRHVLLHSVANGSEFEETINRAIEFNHRAQVTGTDKEESPNCSEHFGSLGAYVFAHDLTTSIFWTSFEAVRYLLAHQAPANEIDEVEIQWVLNDNPTESTVPDFDRPRKVCHGRTLRQILDELIDRRRLLGYTVEVEADEFGGADTINVRPFSFAPEELTYDDGLKEYTLPANSSQVSLVFDSDTAVQTAFVRRATLESIDQVVCIGARAIACFTICGSETATLFGSNETLAKGWTTSQQTEYQTAASSGGGYGGFEPWEAEFRNKAARKNEKLRRVFSYFNLVDDWTGETLLGEAIPYFPVSEDEPDPLPYYQPQLRFLPHLPLKTDHDYRDSNIADEEIPDNSPEGHKWEYLRPLVAIHLPDSSPEQYQLLDRTASNSETAFAAFGVEDGEKWSASVRMQDDAPGIVVTVSGQPQHVLGKGTFTKLSEDEDLAKFDYRTIVATVAMEVDQFCEGLFPLPELVSPSQVLRRMIVHLGDDYQQHYVAMGTMVAIDPETGELMMTLAPGHVRDDRPKLRALARLIYEWYRTERQSVELSMAYISARLSIGDLITTIGQGDSIQTINSVVTLIKYEFPRQEGSGPAAARTTISTQFAELDAKRLVGE